jgi:membrane fusion protein (multidrug efflux system)
MRRLFLSLTLVVLLCAWGCGRASTSGAAAAEETPDAAIPVRVAAVRLHPVQRKVHFVGTLYGQDEVTLSSQIEGQVQRVHADLGDEVEAGAVLAEIDDDLWRARLREAEANLAKARADEVRARQLVADRIISPQEYEQRKTAADVAQAQRDSLAVTLDHARVVAPLRGSVARRFVSAGEYVRAGSPLFSLVVLDPLKLRGEVPERFVPELQPGQVVEIRVDAYGDQLFHGTLARIAPASNVQNRSVSVEALIANPERKLKPGFFANAAIIVRQNDAAPALPQEAIVRFAGVDRVFVIADGRAQARQVELGDRLADGLIEVRTGVRPGEHVALTGLSKLEDGARVTVQRDTTASEAAGAQP